jgi:exodeoxyribonuclease VII large subunit
MEDLQTWPIRIFTVSQLNSRIRETISRPFRSLVVEGEVSNFKIYPSGHLYFTLKDESASLKAVMFNYDGKYPQDMIADGKAVICHGRIDVYEKRGEYRLLADDIEVKGRGLLQRKFELLKEKLLKEGLFDTARKRSLPTLATRIGIVTSPAGAAVRDMLKIALGKFDNLQITIYPVRVQGEQACTEVVAGIEYFNEETDVDVIILGRGGGSLEDLACFNEEVVARAICASRIPIVSGIGHEIDFTIADFCSDVRAPTPTAAADVVVREKQELKDALQSVRDRLVLSMKKIIDDSRFLLYRETVDLKDRHDFITKYQMYLDELSTSMENKFMHLLREQRVRLDVCIQRLCDLNPENILKRGYSITTRVATDSVLSSSGDVAEGERVSVRLYQGSLYCQVEKVVESFNS